MKCVNDYAIYRESVGREARVAALGEVLGITKKMAASYTDAMGKAQFINESEYYHAMTDGVENVGVQIGAMIEKELAR